MDLLSLLALFLGGILALVFAINWRCPWLIHDIRYLKIMLPKGRLVKKWMKEKKLFIDVFEDNVKNIPENLFLIFEDQKYTYSNANKKFNKVANMAIKLGWKRGDIVALFNYNDPEFMWCFMGLQKIGVQIALLNTNLRLNSLQHCIESLPNLKAVIVGKDSELHRAVEEIYQPLCDKGNKQIFCLQGLQSHANKEFIMFDHCFESASDENVNPECRKEIKLEDIFVLIFTSGTTGLPKAAALSHKKRLKAVVLMSLVNITSSDRIYTAMPLYHSAALLGLAGVVQYGAAMVLRRKFSASHFMSDCRKYDVTIVQHIGELCRYVLAQPKSDLDKVHKIRTAVGNGMRKDIYAEFQQRFGIKQIAEFYGATEGNAFLINVANIPGCIGRISPLLSLMNNVYLVKCDIETVQPLRDSNDRCIQVEIGEKGLMLGKIKVNQEFDGYVGKKELSEKKKVRDVFVKGDAYFNTGDILVQDENCYVYFCDRIGDTFRWKGENVSTIEVGNVITELNWIEDANVYGVEVPGCDGKCGMASLTLSPELKENLQSNGETTISKSQLGELYEFLEMKLPSYARPRFIRIEHKPLITGTFKQQKMKYIEEGFDPEKCEDVMGLYFMNTSGKEFVPLGSDMYSKILSGQNKL